MPYVTAVTPSPGTRFMQRHLQEVLMSLSASLANAAVMALRFQERSALGFCGSGNFPGQNCYTVAWCM